MSCRRLTSKYYYNVRKVEQSLKEMIMEKSFQKAQNSKKNSTDSTEEQKRLSFHEHYDSELDITILSSEEIAKEEGNLGNDGFELLVEETMTRDEVFMSSNSNLFSELALMSEQ